MVFRAHQILGMLLIMFEEEWNEDRDKGLVFASSEDVPDDDSETCLKCAQNHF